MNNRIQLITAILIFILIAVLVFIFFAYISNTSHESERTNTLFSGDDIKQNEKLTTSVIKTSGDNDNIEIPASSGEFIISDGEKEGEPIVVEKPVEKPIEISNENIRYKYQI